MYIPNMMKRKLKKGNSTIDTDIALGADGENSCQVFGIRTALLELNLRVVLNGMRVGENPPSGEDEAAAAGAILSLALPREREIGLRVDAEHFNNRVHRRHHLHRALPLQWRWLHGRGAIAVGIGEARAPALR